MKKTLIFIIMTIMDFNIYADDFNLLQQKLVIEDKKSKNNNKNTHDNIVYFKPWLVDDFGYSRFKVKKAAN